MVKNVIATIIGMYITMIPLILGGIANMIFTKTKLYKYNKYPIDNYIMLRDNQRLLGDNKTIIGFISMIILTTIIQILCGNIYRDINLDTYSDWYSNIQNTPINNIWIGSLVGTAYMLLELPNSFIKRRLKIPDGKTVEGIRGTIFLIYDQIDSLIGVFIVLKICSEISWLKVIGYILLGGVTHITINYVLHKLKVRKNI